MRIEFFRGEARRYRSRLHRSDGVVVEFEGGSYNRIGGRDPVPHDLAHLIVEDALALREGVWGVLAAGGMFRHARVVAGRRAPHASRHGRMVIDEAGDRIMQAEVLTRVVCDACAGEVPADPTTLRRVVGERWWSDTLTADALVACEGRLRAAARAWAALPPGTALEASWPWVVRWCGIAGR